jgi:hypothetical protein
VQNSSGLVRIVAIWAAALMAVAVAAAATVSVVNQRVMGPGHLVESYFGLLEDGRGGEALGLLGAETPEGNALLLDGEGLRRSVAPIEDFSVAATDFPAPDQARVHASYTVDGEQHRTTFALHRTGKEWLFFDRWAFDVEQLPTVDVRADTTNEIVVNGFPAPLAEGRTTLPVLLPAVVEAGYQEKYFEAPARRAVVSALDTAERPPMELITRPTQTLVKDIDQQVRAYLDGCAEQQVLKPAGCPLTYTTNSRVAANTIDWDITGYPRIDVGAFDGGWVLRPLETRTKLQLVEQDLMTGVRRDVVFNETFGFTARLDIGVDAVRVTPVAGD